MPYIESIQQRLFLSDEIAENIVIKSDMASLSYLVDYLKKIYGQQSAIYMIRGHKCRFLSSFFDEWAAALQFPFYFGENWDAFIDCLRDLPGEALLNHILVIANSSQLLEEDKSNLSDFYEIISQIPEEWKRIYSNYPNLQLKIILHENEEKALNLETTLQTLNVKCDQISGDWLGLLSE